MKHTIGELDLIMGSMFSGKTEAIQRLIKRSEIANKKVQVFKPKVDDRYDSEAIVTHYGSRVNAINIKHGGDLILNVDIDTDLVVIDEIQFFDEDILQHIQALKREGINFVISGLDMWASGEAIPIVGKLACLANNVTKLKAVCMHTGEDAYISYRTTEAEGDVLVGGSESYIALSEEAYLKARGTINKLG